MRPTADEAKRIVRERDHVFLGNQREQLQEEPAQVRQEDRQSSKRVNVSGSAAVASSDCHDLD